jgi:serine/threonine-protein kinase RsbW
MDMRVHAPWTVQLDVESRFEALKEVHEAVTRVTSAAGLDHDATDNVDVAVRESVVNAMKHGNGMEPARHVHVCFVVDDDALEVTVTDEGQGFDPASLPDPCDEANLLKPDGRGMLFMKMFMDEVAFTFPPTGGTVVRMRKRLS